MTFPCTKYDGVRFVKRQY